MIPKQHESSHLTSEQRYVIKYQLSLGMEPAEIIEKWDQAYHRRVAPSLRTIYSISRQIAVGDCVEPKKAGPRTRSVLTPEKLTEIEDLVEEEPFITNDSLGKLVDIPTSTVNSGLKILGWKKFKAIEAPKLTEAHKMARLKFCKAFLCWNEKCRMAVWWSDESFFRLDLLINHQHESYYAKENEHIMIEKIDSVNSVNVCSAIRGDGSVLYKIVTGKKTAKKYV